MRRAAVALAVLALATALVAADPFERSADELRARLQRRDGACYLNGNSSLGACVDITSVLSSVGFCTFDAYQATQICVSGGSEGALETDQNTQSVYNQYRGQVGSGSSCLNAYQNYLCAIAFPQCVNGHSVFLCESTCKNYYKFCTDGTTGQSPDCATDPPQGIAIVAGSTGPSLQCTGAGAALLPSLAVALAAVLLAVLAHQL